MLNSIKIITLILIIIFNSVINCYSASGSTESYFIVTAYYSPLPGQSTYYTGSYKGDIRLNGSGVNTASGKGVFEGLLAGPKNYPFGTKIYFEGYGVGSIEDRGGAIVKTGVRGQEHDRIDIWMGYGDEGLQRAKKWGRRTVKGVIVSNNYPTTIKLNNSKIFSLPNDIGPDSNSGDIIKLQEAFKEANLYKGEIDGEYKSIEATIISFQIKYGIIKNNDEWGAGYYGNKTKNIFLSKYAKTYNDFPIVKYDLLEYKNIKETSVLSNEHELLLKYGDINIDPESNKEDIIKIQELFTKLGFYDGDLDGKYKSIKDDIIKLQLKIGIIDDIDDWGAGHFGSKTKTVLWNNYNEKVVIKKEIVKYNLNTEFKLTTKQKNDLNIIGEKIQEKVSIIAKKNNTDEDKIINSLIKKIDKIISSSKKSLLIAKLEYIKNLL